MATTQSAERGGEAPTVGGPRECWHEQSKIEKLVQRLRAAEKVLCDIVTYPTDSATTHAFQGVAKDVLERAGWVYLEDSNSWSAHENLEGAACVVCGGQLALRDAYLCRSIVCVLGTCCAGPFCGAHLAQHRAEEHGGALG